MIMITTMQEKINCRKVFVLFIVYASSDKGKDVEDEEMLKRYPILQ